MPKTETVPETETKWDPQKEETLPLPGTNGGPPPKTKIVVLVVRENGKISPTFGERDHLGGVSIDGSTRTYPTEQGDYGTIDYPELKGVKTWPALLVYANHTQPIPLTPDLKNAKPREHPAVLESYLKGRFMDGLSALEQKPQSEALKNLMDFLARIPWWGWLAILAVAALAVVVTNWDAVWSQINPINHR